MQTYEADIDRCSDVRSVHRSMLDVVAPAPGHLHGEAQQTPEALGVAPGVEDLQRPIFVAHMEPMKTMMLRMMANRKASGSHRLTTRTQPLVNFLNTDSLSFNMSGGGVPSPAVLAGPLRGAGLSLLLLYRSAVLFTINVSPKF